MGILPPGKYEFGCSCLCGGTPFSYGNGNGSLEIKEPETAAPVTLSYFNVSNTGKIKLSWQTASESNNDYFEILYSRTGKDFQVIGKVKGAGNSNAIQQYEFIDNVTSASGRSFYRLRQVDTDGKYSYSPVRSVTTKNKMTEILLAPNPTSDLVTVIQDGSYTSMEIYVRDMTGKLMAHYQNHDSETIDFTSFPSGIYAVNIVTEEGVVSKKVARR
jgi:hypothetical protein